MPRKSNKELYFETHKSTIYDAAKGRTSDVMEDKVFAMLLLCGVPASRAYRIAYPQSKATLQSSAALASRRVREPHIQDILSRISNHYWDGLLTLNDDVCTEKTRRRRVYMGKRKDRLDPQ